MKIRSSLILPRAIILVFDLPELQRVVVI